MRKDQHEEGRQLKEATDVFIHLVSGFGAKEGSRDESDPKPKIGETPGAGFETIYSTEDLFHDKTRVRSIVLCC